MDYIVPTKGFVMSSEMIEMLKKYAKVECFYDLDLEEQIIGDCAGGNMDDAFFMGDNAGSTMLARKILDSMGIEY